MERFWYLVCTGGDEIEKTVNEYNGLGESLSISSVTKNARSARVN